MPEDFSTDELLFQLAYFPQPPYLLAGIGLAVGVLCGLTFGRLVQIKLDGWKQDRLPLLPLGSVEITMSYAGTMIGIVLFIGSCLQVFGFAPVPENAIIWPGPIEQERLQMMSLTQNQKVKLPPGPLALLPELPVSA